LADFRVEQVEVDQTAVSNLALETGLTAYDASYLWLANRLGASIVTLDKQLAKAAALSR
jgi:predicted nucleic acid-binding protein